jgi:general secretion pathway protein D
MNLRPLGFSLLLAAVPVALTAQPALPAPADPLGIPNADEVVEFIRMPDAEIDLFIATLEEFTGRTVLRPSTLPLPGAGTFNLVINRPTTRRDIVLAMETVLQLNGLSVIYQDDQFLKLTTTALARTEAPQIIEGSTLDLPPSGRPATKMFTLDFANATALQAVLASMLNTQQGGVAVPLQSSNALLVSDSISNLQKIERVIAAIDRPIGEGLQPKVYQLANARATDVATRLRASFSQQQQQQINATSTINADERTNQIIIMAHARQLPLFDTLISQLDIAATPNTLIETIYIKHADATTVADILSQIITGQTAAAQRINAQTPLQNQQQAQQQGGPQAQQVAAGPAAGPGGAAGPNAAPQPAAPAAAPDGGNTVVVGASANSEFSQLVTVAADARTNSINVVGTVNDLRLIQQIVNGIDILLDQVAIEVIIAEVSLTDRDVNGISALNLTVGTDTPLGTVVPGGTAGTTAILGAAADGTRGTHITNFAGDLGGWIITNGTTNPLAMAATLSDLGSRSNVRVLQSNTIITTHNREATFEATRNQPIVTGTQTDATGAVTSQTTYEEIGITMQVTPLIGSDGGIQLEISQTVDDISAFEVIDGNNTPVIDHREAVSFVNVQDGGMIILGGLQSNRNTNTRSKLGFLWEIPIVSNLLAGRERQNLRTELLFVIRPKVIPGNRGTAETQLRIDQMSNSEDLNRYLQDPANRPQESLLELIR